METNSQTELVAMVNKNKRLIDRTVTPCDGKWLNPEHKEANCYMLLAGEAYHRSIAAYEQSRRN